MAVTSCGVLVRDRAGLVLLGQTTGSARWDIPKGVAEAGEAFADAAVRELREETGLVAGPELLRVVGVFRYLPGKDLALFGWEAGSSRWGRCGAARNFGRGMGGTCRSWRGLHCWGGTRHWRGWEEHAAGVGGG